MRTGWVVVWHGKSCVVYLGRDDIWTLDPDQAKVFRSWVKARLAAGPNKLAKCWYE